MRLRHSGVTWDWEMDLAHAATVSTPHAPTQNASPRPRGRRLPTVTLHGVDFHAITEEQCVQYVMASLAAGRGGVVVTPNLDFLRRASKDMSFSALISEADLVVADGMPLIWASRLQRTPLPARVAGSDLISSLSKAAFEQERSIFLLGGDPGTAERAADVLRARHPGIRIAGTCCPPVGFENDPAQTDKLREMLTSTAPDIVFVALGSPKQERFIAHARYMLPGAWWLGVGISFSFLCGEVKRAPRWVQKIGMEWLHRLMQEPRRLFKRYLLHGVPFAGKLLCGAAMRGITSRFTPAAPVPDEEEASAPRVTGATFHASQRAADSAAERAAETFSMPSPAAGSATRSLHRLRAVVLLGGSVRPSELVLNTGRSVLDLPLDENGSIFCHWLDHAAELARLVGLPLLPVRVLVDQHAPEPRTATSKHAGTYSIERDASEFRGTAGLLSDLAANYGDDDLILVANAAQILLDPLAGVASALDRLGADAGVIAHTDGTPSGIMLFSGKTLRVIPRTGFVDMKEQSLPMIAAHFNVGVVERRRPTGLPIRSLADYVGALRLYHRRRQGKLARIDPLAEDLKPSFSLVAAGATVDPSALLHDSVVLNGATVEAGAVIVRSVICEGASVKRDRRFVEQFVSGSPAR
jgi:N-acetylglucosaminyldiphosphoundecaprenol N-acetyl-beta-D-mannosaminyltransferase